MSEIIKEGEEELVITEVAPKETEKVEVDDKPIKSDEDEESTDDADPERAAIRERRRLEKVERKERRDKAIGRDKTELDFLRKRNDDLERRLTAQEMRAQQTDVNLVDQRLREAFGEVELAEKVIAKAVEAGQGADVAQAMRYRDQAIAKANSLNAEKQRVSQVAPQKSPNSVDDQTMKHAQEFLKEHKWYDPQGKDEDSAVLLAIDQALARDGFNPQTADYWDELKIRAARRLPDRFHTKGSDDRAPRGGPAVGSGREHAPASTRREVYISPERKQALVDAGVWDDPLLRQKYVKRYAQYDKDNRA